MEHIPNIFSFSLKLELLQNLAFIENLLQNVFPEQSKRELDGQIFNARNVLRASKKNFNEL